MKKLVLFAVAIVAISFASCGGNKVDAEKEAQRIADSIAAVAQEEAAKLQEQLAADSAAKALLDSTATTATEVVKK